jgi:hypothetical protein
MSHNNNDRMLASPKIGISIRTPDAHCLIFTCKIPANSL